MYTNLLTIENGVFFLFNIAFGLAVLNGCQNNNWIYKSHKNKYTEMKGTDTQSGILVQKP